MLGLNYMGLISLKFLNKASNIKANITDLNFIKSLLFGTIFSISWTPCIGTFLSSALLMVATQGNVVKGIVLMLIYSVGLGIPFILSAFFIQKLKSTFNFIKSHYDFIKRISGLVLVFMGLYVTLF